MLTILLLIIIYLSFISLGLPDSLLGSAWPSMYNSLNVPLHYAGFISITISGGTVISSILSEKVIRRFGTGMVTAVSVFMTALALVGFSFSPSFIFLCLCAIPLGLGAGSVDAALNNYVALHFKARHMSWLHSFWGVGTTIGPLIMSSYLISANSWSSGYRTIGIIQFCLVAVLFASLPLWIKNSPSINTQKNKPASYKELFSIAGVKEALTVFFLYCAIESTAGLWGASFLVTEKGIKPEIAAQWIALYYFGITSGRFISGFITIKLNNRQMVRMGQIIAGCGIVILFMPFGNKILLPGFFLIGMGFAPIFPSLIHGTPVNFGREYSQAVIGLQMAFAYIGTSIMPPLFGALASVISFKIFPVFLVIILIIKIIMFETLNKKVDKHSTFNTCNY
ncbi:MAG: MFS transporter [Treponema sp.]|jgi:fucose permease|nr:MFS transporter [Treponema sp.]